VGNYIDTNAIRGRTRYPGIVEPKLFKFWDSWGAKCLELDSGEYVNTTYTSGLSSAFTIWVWVKFQAGIGGGEIISKRSYFATAVTDFPFALDITSSYKIAAYLDSGSDWAADLLVESPVLTTDTWHFIAVRGTGSNCYLDTDGTKTTGAKTFTITQGSRPWRLGMPSYPSGGGVGGLQYVGKIYGFGLYNVVKTDSEIAAIRSGYLDKTGALMLWNFSEGQGTALTDLSGNSRNGALTGSVSWVADTPWS
jgi:hypothetical protein